jgi:lysozyme family protein
MNIERIIDGLIDREGGYVNHPDDRGGPTCWGITEAVARQFGYEGSMQQLPVALARKIYRHKYFEAPRFDDIARLSDKIADELVDTGVNMGVVRASLFLQRSLNALNRKGFDYPDLKVDGRIGPATLSAFEAFLSKRAHENGEQVLFRVLNALQGAKYIDIAEHDRDQESFVFGWFRFRVA